MSRILVIKHGALGDITFDFFAFQAIRDHHQGAAITLITTAPFAALTRLMPWFDQVWVDDRPRWRNLVRWLRLARRVADQRFDRVYDLQGSNRTAILFTLLSALGLGRRPEWVGPVKGASHPWPPRNGDDEHIAAWVRRILVAAGISVFPPPDLGWLDGASERFDLPERLFLLIPGCSPHLPVKRWPTASYARLAELVAAQGLTPVVIGSAIEDGLAQEIIAACPSAVSLTGKTSLGDIAALARRAQGAVGNDTGPMHLIAQIGCPTLALFSQRSNPNASHPLGPRAAVVQRPRLDDLTVAEVAAAVSALMERPLITAAPAIGA